MILTLALPLCSSGQTVKATDSVNPELRRTYIGLGVGINYAGVIGVILEQNFGKLSITGGAGLGSWGYKLSGGMRYYTTTPTGVSVVGKGIGVNYALATGLSKVPINLETSSGTKQNVNVQLSPVHLLNLTYFNCWKLGNGTSRFGVELGYSIILNAGDNFKVLDSGVTLSSTSLKTLRIIQPGGLVLGLNFTFGR